MATRPTRKQPAKKKTTVDTARIQKAVSATTSTKKRKGSGKKKVSIVLAVIFVLIIIAGGFGYFFTGKTINYYYVDDSLFEDAGYEHELLDSVKYHIFSDTEFLKIDDYFEDENLQSWKLDWYSDEDGTVPAQPSTVGFGNLFEKQSLYGWLSEKNADKNNIAPYEGTYYDSVSLTVDGLHARLNDGFQATNYNFAGKGEALIQADTPEGKDYVYGIYNAQEFEQDWKSGKNFEREHVWCNSLLGMDRVTSSGKNQASDLHNLRAIGGVHTGAINQSRSNRYFVDCTDTNCNLDKDNDPATHNGHTVGTDAFYPGDEHVGDVSRILMYMMVMYNKILKWPESESDVIAAANNAYKLAYAYMPIADTSLLVTWHNRDSVDDFETHRNNVIYSFQGNRNPFIDKPELLEVIYNQMVAMAA